MGSIFKPKIPAPPPIVMPEPVDVPNYEDIKMIKKITPKQGRVVVFDGMTRHSSTQTTKGPRCIINFDLV